MGLQPSLQRLEVQGMFAQRSLGANEVIKVGHGRSH
jgi:hypothetical protein